MSNLTNVVLLKEGIKPCFKCLHSAGNGKVCRHRDLPFQLNTINLRKADGFCGIDGKHFILRLMEIS